MIFQSEISRFEFKPLMVIGKQKNKQTKNKQTNKQKTNNQSILTKGPNSQLLLLFFFFWIPLLIVVPELGCYHSIVKNFVNKC